MAVYVVTGFLGGGKGVTCARKIEEALIRGAPVVTNMDLRLDEIMGIWHKDARVIRIPDKPNREDLDSLGRAYEGPYCEKNNGVLVLDELGTWFNSRSWSEKGRREIIDWFLHCRKLGWDVYVQAQSFDMIDAQFRNATGQYEIRCLNLLDLKIPIVGFFVKIVCLLLGMKRVQMNVVKQSDALVRREWDFACRKRFTHYDTKQQFFSRVWRLPAEGFEIETGIQLGNTSEETRQLENLPEKDMVGPLFSYLPGWYLKGRYSKTSKQLRTEWMSENLYYLFAGNVFAMCLFVLALMFMYSENLLHRSNDMEKWIELAEVTKKRIDTVLVTVAATEHQKKSKDEESEDDEERVDEQYKPDVNEVDRIAGRYGVKGESEVWIFDQGVRTIRDKACAMNQEGFYLCENGIYRVAQVK